MSKVIVERIDVGDMLCPAIRTIMLVEEEKLFPIFGTSKNAKSKQLLSFFENRDSETETNTYYCRFLDKNQCKQELEKKEKEFSKIQKEIDLIKEYLNNQQ